jgi:hypothetical protein
LALRKEVIESRQLQSNELYCDSTGQGRGGVKIWQRWEGFTSSFIEDGVAVGMERKA